MSRQLDRRDRWLAVIDQGLRTLAAPPAPSRPRPGAGLPEPGLARTERSRSAALVRVNHAGEVAAQALYIGQAAVARSPATREHLLEAAREERDHLDWCAERLAELGGRTSLLGPLWFAGSVCVGAAAGTAGDAASLGFVRETESQVEAHLADHLRRLPAADTRSRALLEQIAEDERRHGAAAGRAGGTVLPAPVRAAMRLGGGMLRRTAYLL